MKNNFNTARDKDSYKKDKKRDSERISHKIDRYSEEITDKNFKNFSAFAFGGMILTGLIALTALTCWGRVLFTREYCVLFVYFALCNLYIHGFLKKHTKYTLSSFYIAMAPILTVGILMGTFLDPNGNAMTIIIMLCTLFVFITDKPRRIVTYILAVSAIFLICSYMCKISELFVGDLINLVIYLSIGLSINMLTLKDRVNSVENYIIAVKRADNDTLTSILNRGAGDTIVKKLLSRGQKGALFIIDIDDFKHINDNYGHQIGDEVIRAVCQQLKNVFRGNDVVWRLGGDEFAVFALDMVNREQCEKRLHQLQQNVASIDTSYPEQIDVRVSIGGSISHRDDIQFDEIYKNSDDALYEAKENGKNGYVIHEITESHAKMTR